MPGFFPHFIMGHAVFLVGVAILKKTWNQILTRNYLLLLYIVCISASIIPDFPLGIYIVFHIGSRPQLLPIHAYVHQIITPIAFALFLVLSLITEQKKRPIWALGLVCILIHVLMDYLIEEMGIWW